MIFVFNEDWRSALDLPFGNSELCGFNDLFGYLKNNFKDVMVTITYLTDNSPDVRMKAPNVIINLFLVHV